MLDRITEWEVGAGAKGLKSVSLSEDFFSDHFPQHPIMPGVLIMEALAQLSGLILEATVEESQGRKIKALLSIIDKAKFRRVSKPGDCLLLDSRIISVHEDAGRVKAVAAVGDKIVAEAEMTFVWITLEDPELERKRRQLLDFWLQDLQ